MLADRNPSQEVSSLLKSIEQSCTIPPGTHSQEVSTLFGPLCRMATFALEAQLRASPVWWKGLFSVFP